MGERKPRVLFLCTGNACRSQMAEGWARLLHGDTYDVHSAGIVAHGQNPRAVEAMRRLGVDIRRQESTSLEALGDIEFDLVVTVCDNAAENVPAFQGSPRILHQPFPDPPALAKGRDDEGAEACYTDVASSIRAWVRELPANL